MQITIKGELTLAEIRQALFEQLHDLEDRYAISHSLGATLYVNPTNSVGDAVVPHHQDGRALQKLHCNGPYKSAADDLKV